MKGSIVGDLQVQPVVTKEEVKVSLPLEALMGLRKGCERDRNRYMRVAECHMASAAECRDAAKLCEKQIEELNNAIRILGGDAGSKSD